MILYTLDVPSSHLVSPPSISKIFTLPHGLQDIGSLVSAHAQSPKSQVFVVGGGVLQK